MLDRVLAPLVAALLATAACAIFVWSLTAPSDPPPHWRPAVECERLGTCR